MKRLAVIAMATLTAFAAFALPDGQQHFGRIADKTPIVTNGYTNAQIDRKIESAEAKGNDAWQMAREASLYARGIKLYMEGGTNAWQQGTNYLTGTEAETRTRFLWRPDMDAQTVPCSWSVWEWRDGKKVCVWDQRDWTEWYWNYRLKKLREDELQPRDEQINALLAQKAPVNWSCYTACGITNPAGNTTWVDTPKVVLSAGYAWQHQIDVNGVGYWGIEGNGFEVGGSGTNATLCITDHEGNKVLEIVKGGSRLEPITSSKMAGCGSGYDNGYVWFGMKTGKDEHAPQPVGEFSISLIDDDFFPEGEMCPAEVREYQYVTGGVWRCYFRLKDGINSDAAFARFTVPTTDATKIKLTAAQEIAGGLIFDGRTIAPEIPADAQVGDTIVWKVVK